MTTKSDLFPQMESVDKEELVRALCNWYSARELTEFVEFLKDEGLIENEYFNQED